MRADKIQSLDEEESLLRGQDESQSDTIRDSQKLPIDKVLVAYYVLKFSFGLFEESQILFLGHVSLISGSGYGYRVVDRKGGRLTE